MPGRGWSRAYCRGVAGLGGAGVRPPVGLIWSPAGLGLAVGLGDPWACCWGVAACWLDTESLPSSVLLPGRGCSRLCCGGLCSCGVAAGACVPVGLLLGLVVIHPVRERHSCCRRRPGHQGPVKEDHVL